MQSSLINPFLLPKYKIAQLSPRRQQYIQQREKANSELMLNKTELAISTYQELISDILQRYLSCDILEKQDIKPYLANLYVELGGVYHEKKQDIFALEQYHHASRLGHADTPQLIEKIKAAYPKNLLNKIDNWQVEQALASLPKSDISSSVQTSDLVQKLQIAQVTRRDCEEKQKQQGERLKQHKDVMKDCVPEGSVGDATTSSPITEQLEQITTKLKKKHQKVVTLGNTLGKLQSHKEDIEARLLAKAKRQQKIATLTAKLAALEKELPQTDS